MAMSNKRNHFEKNVKEQLDMSLTTLDARTQSQLTQARYKALSSTKKARFNLGQWFTGGVSIVLLALLVITVMPTMQSREDPLLATSPEWVLVSDMDDIELYQNLDFYQWLDQTEESNG